MGSERLNRTVSPLTKGSGGTTQRDSVGRGGRMDPSVFCSPMAPPPRRSVTMRMPVGVCHIKIGHEVALRLVSEILWISPVARFFSACTTRSGQRILTVSAARARPRPIMTGMLECEGPEFRVARSTVPLSVPATAWMRAPIPSELVRSVSPLSRFPVARMLMA